MAKDKKRKIGNEFILVLLGILIFLVVVVVVMVTSRFYIETSKKKTKTITNKITMNYTSNINGITVFANSLYDDATGILLDNSENVFDFVVRADIKKSTSAKYEIIMVKDESSVIPDDMVRIYVQKSDLSSFTTFKEIIKPSKYLLSDDIKIGNEKGMIIDKGSFKKDTTVYYRLKLWVDPLYVKKTDDDYFKVNVNIYGKA